MPELSSTRKNIYILIIVASLGVAGFLLFQNFSYKFKNPNQGAPLANQNLPSPLINPEIVQFGNLSPEFLQKLQTELILLQDPRFKSLRQHGQILIVPKTGRSNPFLPY